MGGRCFIADVLILYQNFLNFGMGLIALYRPVSVEQCDISKLSIYIFLVVRV